MSKSIKKNFLYNIILNISKVAFPLITAPYVSRVLEPDGLGLFNFSNVYVSYFVLFAALGIPYYGIREIAKIKDDIIAQTKLVSEILSISIVSTFLCTVIMLLSLLLIPQLKENCIYFVIAGIVLYFTPFRIDWFFSGKEDFGYIALRSIIIKTVSVIFLFLLVHEKSDLLIYVALNAISQVLNDLWNFVKMYRLGVHPHFTFSGKYHIKPLLVLFSSSIAISIYLMLDTLMLGFMTDYKEVGYYNCATHISRAILPLITSLPAAMLPRIASLRSVNNENEINHLMQDSFSLVSYLSFPIVFYIIVISPTFVPLFFGGQFAGTIYPLQIIIFTLVAVGYNNLSALQVLLTFGHDRFLLYSVLSGTVSNIVLNMVLIPKWGAAGAAFASVCAELIVFFVSLHFVYCLTHIRFVKMREVLHDIIVSLPFLMISFLIGLFLCGWVLVIASAIICFGYYVIIQYIFKNPAEIMIIKTISRKIHSLKS